MLSKSMAFAAVLAAASVQAENVFGDAKITEKISGVGKRLYQGAQDLFGMSDVKEAPFTSVPPNVILGGPEDVTFRYVASNDATNTFYPGDSCCTLCDDDYYSGLCGTWCIGYYDQEYWFYMSTSNFNDRMNSWICGKNVAYDLCNNPYGYDDCNYGEGLWGAGSARSYRAYPTDHLTLLKLRQYRAESLGALTFFSSPDCGGTTGRLYASDDVNARRYYNADELRSNNVRTDDISSMYIPFGYSVDIYDGDGYTGAM